ncbi:MAG: hypothetical protein KME26_21125 [Oscillatoria princeps RMCB-10]|nr:hypothetical protein [Oscillatoria princeps RMCB-10]
MAGSKAGLAGHCPDTHRQQLRECRCERRSNVSQLGAGAGLCWRILNAEPSPFAVGL